MPDYVGDITGTGNPPSRRAQQLKKGRLGIHSGENPAGGGLSVCLVKKTVKVIAGFDERAPVFFVKIKDGPDGNNGVEPILDDLPGSGINFTLVGHPVDTGGGTGCRPEKVLAVGTHIFH